MIKLLALDLDGTLLDTLPDIASSGNAMLLAMGRQPVSLETVRGFIGDGIAVLAKRLLTGRMDGEPETELFRRALAAFEEHYSTHLSVATRPFDRVDEAHQLEDIATQFAALNVVDGVLTGAGAGYRARFDRDGVQFVPALGEAAPTEQPTQPSMKGSP